MTLHLTPALEQRLEHLAAQVHRTPDELAQEGMDRFLAYEEEILAAVQKGEEDIKAGRVLEHHEVVARIEGLLSDR